MTHQQATAPSRKRTRSHEFDSRRPGPVGHVQPQTMCPSQKRSQSAVAPLGMTSTPNTIVVDKVAYVIKGVIFKSLYGEVLRASNIQNRQEVAIKRSHMKLVSSSLNHMGVKVGEDVRHEARILRALSKEEPHLAAGDGCCISDHAGFHMSDVVKLATYQKHINAYVGESETESYHLLATRLLKGPDMLTSIMTAVPSLSCARRWFRQMCEGVAFMHAHGIAHLDISMENACLDASPGEEPRVSLIDMGLAQQHPLYSGARRVFAHDTTTNSTTMTMAAMGQRVHLVTSPAPYGAMCSCEACLAPLPVDMPHMRFMCRPICMFKSAPGKVRYMSPELFQRKAFDAYSNDVYSLGVVLYILLAGLPPYTQPCPEQDIWFRVFYSGEWLKPHIRNQPAAVVYRNASRLGLDLVNQILKPQHLRLSLAQVLEHPFFSEL